MQWLQSIWTAEVASKGWAVLLVYAMVAAAGIGLGKVRVCGVSLGATCVLFVGLLASALGFSVHPVLLAFLKDFGMILFVFFVGLRVGPSFFQSFRSEGIRLTAISAGEILISLLLAVLLWYAVLRGHMEFPQVLGVYFGAVSSTPGLGAAQEALSVLGWKGEDIALGYACAYPLGSASLIIMIAVLSRLFRVDLRKEAEAWVATEQSEAPIYFHARITNLALDGRTIREIRAFIGRNFICSRILHEGEITSPCASTQVFRGDVLRIVTAAENKLPICAFCGQEEPGIDLKLEHSPVTTRLIRLTRTEMNGKRIGSLHLSHYDGVNITRVFRSGMTIFPYSSLYLQLGDEVLAVGPERALDRLADLLGNKSSKLDRPNIITLFMGIALGVLAGLVPIALPGLPVPLRLGLAGGPLIVAILLGAFGPRLKVATYATPSVSMMLQSLGLALFMASVGLAAGPRFVEAIVHGHGLLYVAIGLVITVVPVAITGCIARFGFKMNFHSIAGLLAGSSTSTPALAYVSTLAEKSPGTIAYSTVYPIALCLRILTAQLVLLIVWSISC